MVQMKGLVWRMRQLTVDQTSTATPLGSVYHPSADLPGTKEHMKIMNGNQNRRETRKKDKTVVYLKQ